MQSPLPSVIFLLFLERQRHFSLIMQKLLKVISVEYPLIFKQIVKKAFEKEKKNQQMKQEAIEVVCQVEDIDQFKVENRMSSSESQSTKDLSSLQHIIDDSLESYPIEDIFLSEKIEVDHDINFLLREIGQHLSHEDNQMIFGLYKELAEIEEFLSERKDQEEELHKGQQNLGYEGYKDGLGVKRKGSLVGSQTSLKKISQEGIEVQVNGGSPLKQTVEESQKYLTKRRNRKNRTKTQIKSARDMVIQSEKQPPKGRGSSFKQIKNQGSNLKQFKRKETFGLGKVNYDELIADRLKEVFHQNEIIKRNYQKNFEIIDEILSIST